MAVSIVSKSTFQVCLHWKQDKQDVARNLKNFQKNIAAMHKLLSVFIDLTLERELAVIKSLIFITVHKYQLDKAGVSAWSAIFNHHITDEALQLQQLNCECSKMVKYLLP